MTGPLKKSLINCSASTYYTQCPSQLTLFAASVQPHPDLQELHIIPILLRTVDLLCTSIPTTWLNKTSTGVTSRKVVLTNLEKIGKIEFCEWDRFDVVMNKLEMFLVILAPDTGNNQPQLTDNLHYGLDIIKITMAWFLLMKINAKNQRITHWLTKTKSEKISQNKNHIA